MKRFLVALTVIGVALVQIDKVSAQDDTQTVNYDPYSTPTSPTYATPSTSPDSGNTTSDGGSTGDEGENAATNNDGNQTSDNPDGETNPTDQDPTNDDPTGNETDPLDVPFAQYIRYNINKNKIFKVISAGAEYAQQSSTQQIKQGVPPIAVTIGGAFREIGANLILNYGKYFKPVLSDLADKTEYNQVVINYQNYCDEDCVVSECILWEDLAEGKPNIFDIDCVHQCDCVLRVDTLNQWEEANLENTENSLNQTLGAAKNHVQQAVGQKADVLMNSVAQLRQLQLQNQQDFAALAGALIDNLTNCDKICVEDCINGQWVNYFQIPQCMKYCRCKQAFIAQTTHAEYNYPALIHYNQHNKDAWSLFNMLKDKF
ncbi:UNKNOWN [Stylonychia lemnae]|uniref:Uncharacterized protein n=1 Tax=Stylonychia lemnae TaxID=5949 RepID=A0A078AWB9_STYLE|nr:UNKNOWN [Stylonychia lemnae]|eukprot:CDW85532.1 UNKNOWN [Stylonychia lemnae]